MKSLEGKSISAKLRGNKNMLLCTSSYLKRVGLDIRVGRDYQNQSPLQRVWRFYREVLSDKDIPSGDQHTKDETTDV